MTFAPHALRERLPRLGVVRGDRREALTEAAGDVQQSLRALGCQLEQHAPPGRWIVDAFERAVLFQTVGHRCHHGARQMHAFAELSHRAASAVPELEQGVVLVRTEPVHPSRLESINSRPSASSLGA